MIFHQVWRIMSTGLAELAVQELGELPLHFSLMQMLSLLGISSRFCKKQDKSFLLHLLHWLDQLVQVLELMVATSGLEGEVVLATGV